jgi:hypothetical protein
VDSYVAQFGSHTLSKWVFCNVMPRILTSTLAVIQLQDVNKYRYTVASVNYVPYHHDIRGCNQKISDWVYNEITIINSRWEATQRVMAAKLTRLTHKIAIQLYPVADSCTNTIWRQRALHKTLPQSLSLNCNAYPLFRFTHIQKFPDWVDNEICAYNNKHSLRNNTKGYGGKTD